MNTDKAIQAFNKKKYTHLSISVVLDILGMVTYMLPFLGELGDTVFGPFYGIAIFIMYRSKVISAAAGGVIGTIEELLPATDVLPTATIMWIYTYIFKKDSTLKLFVEEKQKEIDTVKQVKGIE